MAFKDWIKKKEPERVFVEGGEDRYMQQDFDVPPDPAAVVRLGLAATIEEAVAGIAASKKWWGGSRLHVGLDHMEQVFGPLWPTTLLFGAKPAMLAKLLDADFVTVETSGTPVRTPMGYKTIFEDWGARGLIK